MVPTETCKPNARDEEPRCCSTAKAIDAPIYEKFRGIFLTRDGQRDCESAVRRHQVRRVDSLVHCFSEDGAALRAGSLCWYRLKSSNHNFREGSLFV